MDIRHLIDILRQPGGDQHASNSDVRIDRRRDDSTGVDAHSSGNTTATESDNRKKLLAQ